MRTPHASRGFTLIEVLVYIALITLIMSSIVGYSLSLGGARARNYVVQNVQSNGRVLLSTLGQQIRASALVSTPAAGTSSNQLVLTMPSGSPGVVFSLSSGRVVMSVVGSPDVFLTDDRTTVSNLVFTNTALAGERDSISIQAQVSYAAAAGDVGYSYSEQLRTTETRRN